MVSKIALLLALFSPLAFGAGLTYPISSSKGGTGVASPTAGRMCIANGSSPMSFDAKATYDTATKRMTLITADADDIPLILKSTSNTGVVRQEFQALNNGELFEFSADFNGDELDVQSDTHTIFKFTKGGDSQALGTMTVGQSPNASGITSSATGLVLGGGATGTIFPNATTGAGIRSGNSPRRLDIIAGNGSTTGFPIVVSAAPSNYGLMIVRGQAANDGGGVCNASENSNNPVAEGWTCATTGTAGRFQVTFGTAFADNPICLANSANSSGTTDGYVVGYPTTTTVDLQGRLSGTNTNTVPVAFICIGQRGA
jgi:hypothetical protein